MKEIHRSTLKHEFLLRLKSDNIEKLDDSFRKLIKQHEFDATLLTPNLFKEENKAIYRVKMDTPSLVAFKKKLDEVTKYDCFEVFEFKAW